MLYGLMVVSGIIIAAWFVGTVVKDKFDVWEALSFVLVAGIIGARLYHVINFWDYYSQNPTSAVALWNGGLGIFGGILGGVAGLFIYSRLHHIRLLTLLDLSALGLPLAQAIGRFGNIFNQELFGQPTTLPWGIYIDPANRPFEVSYFSKFHPLAIYESLGCLFIFLILVWLLRRPTIKPKLDGRLFFTYIALYGLLRFFLEPLRIESWTIGKVDVTEAICLFFVTAGLIGLLKDYARSKI